MSWTLKVCTELSMAVLVCSISHHLWIQVASPATRNKVSSALRNKIDWNESFSVPLRNKRVKVWQVKFIGCPPVPKKFNLTETIEPICSGDAVIAAGIGC